MPVAFLPSPIRAVWHLGPLAMVRVSDGALGFPGALAAGSAAAWLACRRAGVKLAPVAGAAAPGLAFGLALGCVADWFGQQLYGRPSALPGR
jgi:prolipoprotein diacylglyceryltransferase